MIFAQLFKSWQYLPRKHVKERDQTNYSHRAGSEPHQKANPISDAHSGNNTKLQHQCEKHPLFKPCWSTKEWARHCETQFLLSFLKPRSTFQTAHLSTATSQAIALDVHSSGSSSASLQHHGSWCCVMMNQKTLPGAQHILQKHIVNFERQCIHRT